MEVMWEEQDNLSVSCYPLAAILQLWVHEPSPWSTWTLNNFLYVSVQFICFPHLTPCQTGFSIQPFRQVETAGFGSLKADFRNGIKLCGISWEGSVCGLSQTPINSKSITSGSPWEITAGLTARSDPCQVTGKSQGASFSSWAGEGGLYEVLSTLISDTHESGETGAGKDHWKEVPMSSVCWAVLSDWTSKCFTLVSFLMSKNYKSVFSD